MVQIVHLRNEKYDMTSLKSVVRTTSIIALTTDFNELIANTDDIALKGNNCNPCNV